MTDREDLLRWYEGSEAQAQDRLRAMSERAEGVDLSAEDPPTKTHFDAWGALGLATVFAVVVFALVALGVWGILKVVGAI